MKPGDEVSLDGGSATVIKVETLGEAAAKVPVEAAPAVNQMEVAWNRLVVGIIRRARGLKPEDEVELPEGETGRYIKYAMDPSGQYLSPGKGHGRRKVRFTTQKAEVARITHQLVSAGLAAAFKRAQAEAEAASTPENKVEMKPLDINKLIEIKSWAEAHAPEVYRARIDGGKSKAARKRHRMSRRVGFELVAGNKAKNTFSAA